MSKNSQLIILFNFFKFKNIKKTEFDNLKPCFIYYIHSEFYKILEISDNYKAFNKNIEGNDNNLLFYTGVEYNTRKEMEKYKDLVDKSLISIFNIKKEISLPKKPDVVKIKVGKNKKNSLVCILSIVEIKSSNPECDDSELFHLYCLFPIRYGDFHK